MTDYGKVIAFGCGALVGAAITIVRTRKRVPLNTETVINPRRYDGATFMADAPTAADKSTWYLIPDPQGEYPGHTVLISAPYFEPHMARFTDILKAWNISVHPISGIERMEEHMILRVAEQMQIDGVICGDDRYTEAAFASMSPGLKVVSKWGTGIDSINLAAAKKYGVLVGNTENAFSRPVSDSIISYCLQFCRMQIWNDRLMKAGEWKKSPGRSLSECTIGVIGLGNVGKNVVSRAFGFGCRILGTDLPDVMASASLRSFCSQYNVDAVDLDTLCRASDFVCVCSQLTHGGEHPTFHLIDDEKFAMMKPEAVLINCARGPIVHEKALVRALKEQRIAGAALDVFEEEPLPAGSLLRHMDNVILAPHNSNSSPVAHEAVHWSTMKNLFQGLGLKFVEQHKILADSRLR